LHGDAEGPCASHGKLRVFRFDALLQATVRACGAMRSARALAF
jgi:hypothetical protein